MSACRGLGLLPAPARPPTVAAIVLKLEAPGLCRHGSGDQDHGQDQRQCWELTHATLYAGQDAPLPHLALGGRAQSVSELGPAETVGAKDRKYSTRWILASSQMELFRTTFNR